MDLKKSGHFNWIEMDSKYLNLDLTRTKRIHFCPFQSIFVFWEYNYYTKKEYLGSMEIKD